MAHTTIGLEIFSIAGSIARLPDDNIPPLLQESLLQWENIATHFDMHTRLIAEYAILFDCRKSIIKSLPKGVTLNTEKQNIVFPTIKDAFNSILVIYEELSKRYPNIVYRHLLLFTTAIPRINKFFGDRYCDTICKQFSTMRIKRAR